MGLMKKLTSAIVAASLVFGLVGTAFADWSAAGVATAANRMKALGIVKGTVLADGSVDMALNANITRAQLVTIIVRAFGQGDNAALLKGAPAFTDSASHWASGEIAIAKNIIEKNGFTLGTTASTFSPNKDVSAAEAIAFVMKFLGVKAAAGQTWPMDYIQGALDAGLLSADDKAALAAFPNSAANRGLVFYLADKAFASYKLGNGKTMYTTYVDTTAPVVSVDTYNATTEADSITLTGKVSGAAVLHVGFSAKDVVTPDIDGTWSATVPLKVGANDIWVHAVDAAGNVGTPATAVKITRVAGAAVTIEAGAVSVEAGATADLAVVVKDAKGNVIEGAAVTGDAGGLGTYADGKFTAGTKAGTGTLTLKSGDATATVDVTVKAGQLAKIEVSPATVDLKASTTQKFTAKGLDANGNEVALDSVTWNASKGVMAADGTFGATADAAGTVTITATSGSFSGTATAIVYGAAAKVQMAAPAALVGNNKSTTTLTATVLDASGNVAKDFNGNVTFASSAPGVVSVQTASVQAVNGVATTNIQGVASGTTVLSASASGVTGTTLTYTTTAQVATSVEVTGPSSLAASSGSSGKITLVLKDQTGNDMLAAPTSTVIVKLTSSDKTVAFFGTDSDNSGDLTLALSSGKVQASTDIKATAKVGSASVSAAVTAPTGSTITVNNVSVNTLVVGSAYQIKVNDITGIKAGESFPVGFKVLDFNGNTLTAFTDPDNYTLEVYQGATLVNTVTLLDVTLGVGDNAGAAITIDPTTFSAPYSDKANTYTVKVKKIGLVTGENSVVVAPAVAASLAMTATPSTLAANGGAQSTLKVTISDAYGNAVADGSYAVTIKKTSSNGSTAIFTDTIANTVNGVATVAVTSTTKADATGDTFTATATGLTGATANVKTAIMGTAYKLNLPSLTPSGTAGTDIDVSVDVQDGNSTKLTPDQGRVVTLTVKDGTTTVGSFTGTTVNGTATVKVNLTTAKAYTFEATADGLVKVAGTSLTVNPAAAAAVKLVADRTTLSANAGSKAKLTASLLDQYGNTVTVGADTAVKLKVTSGTTATLEGADVDGYVTVTILNGTSSISTVDGTSSLAASTAAGTVTVTATSGTLTSATLNVSTVVAGDAAALTVDTVTDTKASGIASPIQQEIVVRLVDGNGTQLTQAGTNVTITLKKADGTTDVDTTKVKLYYHDGTSWQLVADATPLTRTQALVKGQVKFGVINTENTTLTYQLENATSLAAGVDKTATGKFVPNSVAAVVVNPSTPNVISGDGVALTTVTAKIVDAYGNTVPDFSGTVSFEITLGNDYAQLLSTSASTANGVAAVAAQAKTPTNDGTVKVTAKIDLNADGDTVDSGETSAETTVFMVDRTPPTATSINITGAQGDNNAYLSTTTAVTPGATVSDAGGIKSVKFEFRNVTDSGATIDLGTDSDATGGYNAIATTGTLVDAKTYEFKITVTDVVDRVTTLTRNMTVDTTAPVINSIKVISATSIEVTFGEAISTTGLTTAGWSIDADGAGAGVAAAPTAAALKSGTNNVVVLTTAGAVAGTTTVAYARATGTTTNVAGVEVPETAATVATAP